MHPHHQNLRRLSYFKAIVDAGSIRGAAFTLSVSSAVVSEALSDLEKYMGVSLLKRTTRSIELTSTGEKVYAQASNMVHSAQAALYEGSKTIRPTGPLSITAPTEIASTILSDVIMEFTHEYPDVELTLNATDRMLDMQMGENDIAFRAILELEPSTQNITCPDIISKFPLCLSARTEPKYEIIDGDVHVNIPLLGAAEKDSNRLKGLNLITQSVQNFHFQNHVTIDNRLAALTLVEKGLGAVLHIAHEKNMHRFKTVPILTDYQFGSINVSMVMRDKQPSLAAQAFQKTVLKASFNPVLQEFCDPSLHEPD